MNEPLHPVVVIDSSRVARGSSTVAGVTMITASAPRCTALRIFGARPAAPDQPVSANSDAPASACGSNRSSIAMCPVRSSSVSHASTSIPCAGKPSVAAFVAPPAPRARPARKPGPGCAGARARIFGSSSWASAGEAPRIANDAAKAARRTVGRSCMGGWAGRARDRARGGSVEDVAGDGLVPRRYI